MEAPPTSRLLRIPAEIRLRSYDVLLSPICLQLQWPQAQDPLFCTSRMNWRSDNLATIITSVCNDAQYRTACDLVFLCNKIRREALPLFYRSFYEISIVYAPGLPRKDRSIAFELPTSLATISLYARRLHLHTDLLHQLTPLDVFPGLQQIVCTLSSYKAVFPARLDIHPRLPSDDTILELNFIHHGRSLPPLISSYAKIQDCLNSGVQMQARCRCITRTADSRSCVVYVSLIFSPVSDSTDDVQNVTADLNQQEVVSKVPVDI